MDDPDLELLLAGGALCGNARLHAPESEDARWEVYGDPTEACLLVSAQKGGMEPAEQEKLMPRVKELPFESRRKRMTTVHELEDALDGARRVAFVKGAPNEVLRLSEKIRVNGEVVPLTDELRAQITAANDGYAADGLRVLAVAYRALGKDAQAEGLPGAMSDYTPDNVECHLTFVGLEVMADPPRPEVAAAVAECHRAGIRIVMITGDYGLTAASIARRLRIVEATTSAWCRASSSPTWTTPSSKRSSPARWCSPAWPPSRSCAWSPPCRRWARSWPSPATV